jgi:hypothetical protein
VFRHEGWPCPPRAAPPFADACGWVPVDATLPEFDSVAGCDDNRAGAPPGDVEVPAGTNWVPLSATAAGTVEVDRSAPFLTALSVKAPEGMA